MNLKPEELVKALREDCKTCSENPICENGTNLAGLYCANKDAADQIERDQKEIEALRAKVEQYRALIPSWVIPMTPKEDNHDA